MTESDWLKKAIKIHQTCMSQQDLKNGSKKITKTEAAKINELQHAIGSHHGIQQVAYNEALSSLGEMLNMVKKGVKTPPLTQA